MASYTLGCVYMSLAQSCKRVRYWARLSGAEGLLGEAYKVSTRLALEKLKRGLGRFVGVELGQLCG